MIILATQSEARRKLFKKCKRNAIFTKADVDERRLDSEGVEDYLLRVSFLKASVFYKNGITVIGADTVIEFEGKIIGKPKDDEEAFAILKMLSGKYHRCLTGVTVLKDNRCISFVDEALVYMDHLSDDEIWEYVKSGEYKGKAAGYAIQKKAGRFMRVVRGDVTTVVGLPMKRLCSII